jgi:hypothetical protein
MRGGFAVFDRDPRVERWAKAAHKQARLIAVDPATKAANLRHGETWFVGVDALPNAADGSIGGIPLTGPWLDHITTPTRWHPAQLSIVYPDYPKQDAGESDANHRYRITRHAAHVDGLLPVGPARRRFLLEPHAFILGLPLNLSVAAPLMVWPGSHRIMGDALRDLIGAKDPSQVDLTEGYQAARRHVFETITPQPVIAKPGASVLLHRHLLHGVAPWAAEATAPPEGRMIAYFRPQFSAKRWLAPD